MCGKFLSLACTTTLFRAFLVSGPRGRLTDPGVLLGDLDRACDLSAPLCCGLDLSSCRSSLTTRPVSGPSLAWIRAFLDSAATGATGGPSLARKLSFNLFASFCLASRNESERVLDTSVGIVSIGVELVAVELRAGNYGLT